MYISLDTLQKSIPPGAVSLLRARRGVPLHAMVTSCGKSMERSASYRWDGQKRGDSAFAVFQYTLSGTGVLLWEDERFSVKPGNAMLTMIPHNHCYFFNPREDSHWSFFYICINGSEALRLIQSVIERCGPVIDLASDSPLVSEAADFVRRSLESSIPDPYAASSAAYSLCIQLLGEADKRDMPPEENSLVRKGRRIMRESVSLPLSVEQIAQAAGTSRSHFTRLFSRAEGIGPHEYLEDLRINRACSLLYSTQRSVKDVAGECGFTDPRYFSKVFKNRTGYTPSDFRKSRI